MSMHSVINDSDHSQYILSYSGPKRHIDTHALMHAVQKVNKCGKHLCALYWLISICQLLMCLMCVPVGLHGVSDIIQMCDIMPVHLEEGWNGGEEGGWMM